MKKQLPIGSSLRTLPLLGLGLLLLPALACGGEKGNEAGSAPTAETPAASAEPSAAALDFDSCAGFGVAQAAEFLGLPAAEVEDHSAQQSWGKDCSYVRTGDVMYETAVSFTLTRADTADQAALEMAQLADHASVADQVMPGENVSHRVADLGDEAIWVASNDSLYVRTGAVTILVTLPKDEARQVELARTLLR